MLAPSNPRLRNIFRAALRMRSSTSPSRSFGGRPMRTAARREPLLFVGISFKSFILRGFCKEPFRAAVRALRDLCISGSLCKQNETVSFLLKGKVGRSILQERNGTVSFYHSLQQEHVMLDDS